MKEPPKPRRRRIKGPDSFSFNPVMVIIAVNLLMYVVTLFSRDVIASLGLVPIIAWEQPWRIITSMFLHSSFSHIFANMLTLYFFGRFLSMLVGDKKFLLVYFIGGIFGNIVYAIFGEPLSIAIGASGAVYAVAGALVVMTPKLRVHLYMIIPMPLWVVVLIFFVILSFIPGVAWQAHFGGLALGLIAGYYFKRRGGYYYIR